MKIKFYGTRGSVPVCSCAFQEYGGDTTCILCEGPVRTIILDAGTGIRHLGKEMANDPDIGKKRPLILAFTHFHWDHIQGLPFFAPAYDSSRKVTISAIGKERFGKDIRGIFEKQMLQEYFPIPLEGMGAEIDFMQSQEDFIKAGQATVEVVKHNHPGDAYSYRFTTQDGKILVFCTDIEYGDKIDDRIVDLARGADLLIHEGQYTPEELESHRGWGHCSWLQATEVAKLAEVKQLVITHHDPEHDDKCLREIEKNCQKVLKNSVLAKVGMEIQI